MARALAWLIIVVMCIGGAIFLLLNLTGRRTLKPAVPLSPVPAPVRKFEVVAEYPHDPQALTQGLIYSGGFLYESTGREGQSSIRKVDLKTGRVIQQRAVDSRFLGEGLTEWRGQLIQLTPLRTKPNGPSLMLEHLKTFVNSFGRSSDIDSGVRYDLASLEPKSRSHTQETDGDSLMTIIRSS